MRSSIAATNAPSTLSRLGAAIVSVMRAANERRAERAAAQEMLMLSDAQLVTLGLTREQVVADIRRSYGL